MHISRLILLFLVQICLSFEDYQYIQNGIYTISDNSTGRFASVGTSPVDGIVEFKLNTSHKWRIWQTKFTLAFAFHVIRDEDTKKYIHFPEIKDGAIAVLSDTPSLARVNEIHHTSYDCNFFSIGADNRRLYWVTEPYSSGVPTMVLKLKVDTPKSLRYTLVPKGQD
ncbi:hypothetical protein MGYG_08480 [Nannizzia gypsea CBS 118893]|uniref:Uncharacterized protein n=1 Tax=Arthroderma gypseum (strain ATCC MYA-4604 / CBS 118893) TaxID=535722 RepID=E4V5U2_ARTGP|nr:hypothetical protein MGYG_08480 [Nannizzia gypsea CBS 118893]EFR05467.1 hypothetical protein MGYG_08480 [Nannizzia gypsea CBS 118893]